MYLAGVPQVPVCPPGSLKASGVVIPEHCPLCFIPEDFISLCLFHTRTHGIQDIFRKTNPKPLIMNVGIFLFTSAKTHFVLSVVFLEHLLGTGKQPEWVLEEIRYSEELLLYWEEADNKSHHPEPSITDSTCVGMRLPSPRGTGVSVHLGRVEGQFLELI